MFYYYLKLASKSIKRTPWLSGLMMLAIALGIGACMTTITVNYLMSANPIPEKAISFITFSSTAGARILLPENPMSHPTS